MIEVVITDNTITPYLKKLKKKMSDAGLLMEKIGSYMASSTQRKIKNGIKPANAPLTQNYKKNNLPLTDTGRLLASITYKSDSEKAVVGTNVIYAKIQQEGGKIKPKKAKMLAIPSGAKTRTLMRRYGQTPRACIDKMKQEGYFIYTPKGKKVVMAKKGKRGKPFVLFILKKEVDIPKRPFLFVDVADKKIIKRMVDEWLVY
jgi:phage gpG-like protein